VLELRRKRSHSLSRWSWYPTGSSSIAESEELESHSLRCALVSSEARPLAGSPSKRPGRI
jgi:hypothetical protein